MGNSECCCRSQRPLEEDDPRYAAWHKGTSREERPKSSGVLTDAKLGPDNLDVKKYHDRELANDAGRQLASPSKDTFAPSVLAGISYIGTKDTLTGGINIKTLQGFPRCQDMEKLYENSDDADMYKLDLELSNLDVDALPERPLPSGSGRQRAPPSKGPFTPSGRKRAVLVGINYTGTKAALKGCINDVKKMQGVLLGQGWKEDGFRILTDDAKEKPTRANIESSLRWLVEGAKAGDVFFFHYSGHGAQQIDTIALEEDGMSETICPLDFERKGMISDTELADAIVNRLPEGVRLTVVMDCCHSGTALNLPFEWKRNDWKELTNPYHSLGDVQMFSGCEDNQTSADAQTAFTAPGGAMTTAFCDVLKGSSQITYTRLIEDLQDLLRKRKYQQRPQLSSTQKFPVDRVFSFDSIMANTNEEVGQLVKKKFKPKNNPKNYGGPFGSMVGTASKIALVSLLNNNGGGKSKSTSRPDTKTGRGQTASKTQDRRDGNTHQSSHKSSSAHGGDSTSSGGRPTEGNANTSGIPYPSSSTTKGPSRPVSGVHDVHQGGHASTSYHQSDWTSIPQGPSRPVSGSHDAFPRPMPDSRPLPQAALQPGMSYGSHTTEPKQNHGMTHARGGGRPLTLESQQSSGMGHARGGGMRHAPEPSKRSHGVDHARGGGGRHGGGGGRHGRR